MHEIFRRAVLSFAFFAGAAPAAFAQAPAPPNPQEPIARPLPPPCRASTRGPRPLRSSPATTSTSSPAAAGSQEPRSRPTSRAGAASTSWRSATSDTLRDILEKAAKRRPEARARRPADRRLLRELHGRGGHRGARASARSSRELDAHRRASSRKRELAAVLARLQRDGVAALFRFGSEPDFKNADQTIATATRAASACPTATTTLRTRRDSRDAARAVRRRTSQKMFELAGRDADGGGGRTPRPCSTLETALAKVSLDRVERRDPAEAATTG